MKKLFLWILIGVLEFLAVFAPSVAMAQTASYTGLAAINKIILGATGITATSIAGATSVAAGAVESARLASGLTIPVATSAVASFNAARLAGIAGTVMKAGTFVGIASIVIPMIGKKYGIYVCPPPEFFCKDLKQLNGTYTVGGFGSTFTSSLAAGRARAAQICQQNGVTTGQYCPTVTACTETATSFNCSTNSPSYSNIPGNRTASPDTIIPNQPTSVSDISQPLQTEMSNSASAQKSVYDAVKTSGVPFVTSDVPVVVTAPAVSSPPIRETSTIQNADGSTSTKIISTVTTVTPVVTGTTLSTTNITYPSTTTSTTTITNNTTNVTNSTTTTNEQVLQPDKNTEPVEKPKNICETNPELTSCKNSSVSGACKELTCSGDAITCAIAQQAAESNCRAVKEVQELKDTASYILGNTALAGGPDPLSGVPTRANATTVNAQSIDQSGWLGGGACFPDKDFTIQGKTVTIPFNKVCEYLAAFRVVVMMVGLIGAARILAGAVIRE